MANSKLRDRLQQLSMAEAAATYVDELLGLAMPLTEQHFATLSDIEVPESAELVDDMPVVEQMRTQIFRGNTPKCAYLYRLLTAPATHNGNGRRVFNYTVGLINVMHSIVWNWARRDVMDGIIDQLNEYGRELVSMIDSISKAGEASRQNLGGTLSEEQQSMTVAWCKASEDILKGYRSEAAECEGVAWDSSKELTEACKEIALAYPWFLRESDDDTFRLVRILNGRSTPEDAEKVETLIILFDILFGAGAGKNLWEGDPLHTAQMAAPAFSAYQKIFFDRRSDMEMFRGLLDLYMTVPMSTLLAETSNAPSEEPPEVEEPEL